MKRILTLLFVLLCLGALAGCGETKKEEAKPEGAQAPQAEQAAPAGELLVGFVYVSPVGDAGYSYAHDQGRKVVEEMDGVMTMYQEAVPEGPDSERVILNMARKGAKLIFTTSYGYMDPTIRVAKEFPETFFMHCSGFKMADNAGNYFGRMYQARYLTGMVAGAMTKSNIIGYAAAFPIPEVIRGINAFTLGVRAVNPEAQVRVVWTKTWYDPTTEKEAAKSLIDVGADVITQHQDSPGPQEAAQERGVYSIGYNTDMSAFAPKSHLTAAIWNWGAFYKDQVEKVKSGAWKPESLWWGMETGIVGLAPFGPMVPEDVKAKVLDAQRKIVSKELVVFAGPVKNQKGEMAIPAGQTATDEQLLGMSWFVEGVVGGTE